MSSNKLLANESKTSFILFGRRPPGDELKIKVGNEIITEKSTLKFLGVTFSHDLKWDVHINQLKSILLSRLYLIRHLTTIIPRSCMKTIAEGLFNSTLRYGICLYLRPCLCSTDPTSNALASLQTIQNDMIRAVAGVHRRDKVNMAKLRDTLGFFSVNQILCQAIVTEAQKIKFHDTVPAIKTVLTATGPSTITTRSRSISAVKQPRVRSRKTEGFPTFAAKLLNSLPEKIRKMNTDKSTFKPDLHEWVKRNIN